MRTLIWLLVLPLLLVTCVLIAYRVPLPGSLEGSRHLISAGAVGVIGAGYLVGLTAYLFLSLRRAGRALDATLAPLGLSGAWAPPFGRVYGGTFGERQVQVVYRPAYALQPAALDVTADAHPGQRLATSSGPQRPLLDCRDCPRLPVPGLPGTQVYAESEAAARALLARPEVQSALERFFALFDAASTRELYLQADRVWFRARLRMPADVVAARLNDLLSALSTLAEATEQRNGAP